MKLYKAYSHTALAAGLALILNTAMAGSAVASPAEEAAAVSSYSQEKVGVGAGIVAGGVLAGPPGIVVGAIVGSLLGRHSGMQADLENRRQALQQAQTDLRQAHEHNRELVQATQAQSVKLASLEAIPASAQIPRQDPALAGLSLFVQFRTASDTVEMHYAEQVRRLAEFIKGFPGIGIEVIGYADPRGSDAANQDLSRRRAQAVGDMLVGLGLPADVVTLRAMGEQESLQLGADPEGMGFDRRVLIRVKPVEVRS